MKKNLLTAVALVASVIVLVVGSVFGTIAYLTASSAVSNTFTVGSVAITMWETKVNEDGVFDASETKVHTNSYHLVPGGMYMKNPTIEITSSLEGDDMFLYVKSRNGIRNIEEGNQTENPEPNAALSMRQQMEKNGWVQLLTSADGKDIVWVYGTRDDNGVITPTPVNKNHRQTRLQVATQIVNDKISTINVSDPAQVAESEAGKIQLCSFFKVDKRFTNLSEHNSSFVDFVAFAIQTSGIDSASAGWDALKSAHENATAIINPKNPYDPSAGVYDAVPKA
ncbi:MAG: hypothetical protein IKK58_04135 [Clostridia bacterium]|nr:hypothetical protein [Clostridia bacterium]